MALSAIDSINAAVEHTKQQLFAPFRFGQWARLALVGFLAGELSSFGGCNGNVPSGNVPHHKVPHIDPALFIPVIALLAIAVPVVVLVFLYINSRMRFVLFDSVVSKSASVGRMWNARGGPGLQFFLWQIVFSLISLAGTAVLIGVPLLAAFLLGWFTNWREHLAAIVLTGFLLFIVLAAWIILTAVVHVFSKDFVVPMMALENVSAFEGWGRLIPMIEAEKGRYGAYAGMKLLLAMGAGIAVGIVSLILILLVIIPVGGLGAISVLAGHAAGLTWNVFTITAAVVAGIIVLFALIYCLALVSVPVIVFFPAYAIHFFASRYPLLANLISPVPPAPPPVPPAVPPLAPA